MDEKFNVKPVSIIQFDKCGKVTNVEDYEILGDSYGQYPYCRLPHLADVCNLCV